MLIFFVLEPEISEKKFRLSVCMNDSDLDQDFYFDKKIAKRHQIWWVCLLYKA